MRVTLVPADLEAKRRIDMLTDENGSARFHSVAPGRYHVITSRLGVEVGPGTVIVETKGPAERIPVEWPMRAEYQVLSVAGRFQHPVIEKKNPIEGLIHPHVDPLANATLTLSRIDSEELVGATTTDSDGAFAFKIADPGSYLLHPRAQFSRHGISDRRLLGHRGRSSSAQRLSQSPTQLDLLRNGCDGDSITQRDSPKLGQ